MNKNPFLAAAFISALLLSAVAGTRVVNLVVAQFNPMHSDPDPNPPLIRVLSPTKNQIYNSTSVWLNFTVRKPESWFVYNVAYGCQGEITFVRYNLDGKESENISANDIAWGDYQSPLGRTLDFSINLTGLSEGPHMLIVSAEGKYYYYREQVLANTVVGNSTEIRFTVDTLPPKITIQSVNNVTYYVTEVPLTFTVDEPVSWIGYSIDREAAVTITGNVTLPELSYGSHNLTLYVTDMAGNTATSETIHFTIAKPEPFPATLAAVASTASAAVVVAGLLIYFKKRKC